jgi:hypothetical protein
MDSQAFWHFHCPECSFGDTEHGQRLTAHEIHCIVCMEEESQEVRLHGREVIRNRKAGSVGPLAALQSLVSAPDPEQEERSWPGATKM